MNQKTITIKNAPDRYLVLHETSNKCPQLLFWPWDPVQLSESDYSNAIIEALHTAQADHGFHQIELILPYLPHARDNLTNGPLHDMISKFEQSNCQSLVTFDIHQPISGLHNLAITSICCAPLFAAAIDIQAFDMIIAPDKGAHARCQKLADITQKPLRVMAKTRVGAAIKFRDIPPMHGNILLYDDIIDTGQTILEAAKVLQSKGVHKLYLCIAHWLNNDTHMLDALTACFEHVWVANTVKLPLQLVSKKNVTVFSFSELLNTIVKY